MSGYTSRRYEMLEDLAEKADYTPKGTDAYEQAIAAYVTALHSTAVVRSFDGDGGSSPATSVPKPKVKRKPGRPKGSRTRRHVTPVEKGIRTRQSPAPRAA